MATLKNTTVDDTGFIRFPVGTTAQRPGSPTPGMARYNSNLAEFEGFTGTFWFPIGSPLKGDGTNRVFLENDPAVSGNYTIVAQKNSVTAGPVTINNGVTVTVLGHWSIV